MSKCQYESSGGPGRSRRGRGGPLATATVPMRRKGSKEHSHVGSVALVVNAHGALLGLVADEVGVAELRTRTRLVSTRPA